MSSSQKILGLSIASNTWRTSIRMLPSTCPAICLAVGIEEVCLESWEGILPLLLLSLYIDFLIPNAVTSIHTSSLFHPLVFCPRYCSPSATTALLYEAARCEVCQGRATASGEPERNSLQPVMTIRNLENQKSSNVQDYKPNSPDTIGDQDVITLARQHSLQYPPTQQ